MVQIKYSPCDRETLDRFRGLVHDQNYIDTLHKTDCLVRGLLDSRECETRQQAFDIVFGLLQRDVKEYFDNEPRPNIIIEDEERFGKPVKVITVNLQGFPTQHIEVYGDALFVDGEQIGGV